MRSRFRGASRGGGIDHSGEDAKIQVGSRNLDHRVVKSFGEEWSRFDNQRLEVDELEEMFSCYTSVFPWEDLPDAVVSRTVDWFIKEWQRCPTLNEFMQQSQREHTLQRSSNQKREMANCRKCDSGWIEVGEDSGQFKPCESCRPETFDNWATGEYAPS